MRDAAVALLRLPVRKACYDDSARAGLAPCTVAQITTCRLVRAQTSASKRGVATCAVQVVLRIPCVAPGGRGSKAVSGGDVCLGAFGPQPRRSMCQGMGNRKIPKRRLREERALKNALKPN